MLISKNYDFNNNLIKYILDFFNVPNLPLEIINDTPDLLEISIDCTISIYNIFDGTGWVTGIIMANDLELLDEMPPTRGFSAALISGLSRYFIKKSQEARELLSERL